MEPVTFKFEVACYNAVGLQYLVYCRDTNEVSLVSDIWHYRMGGFPGLRKWHADRPSFLQKYPSFTIVVPIPDKTLSVNNMVRVTFKKRSGIVGRVLFQNCCYAKAFKASWLAMDGNHTCATIDYWAKAIGQKYHCNHVPKMMSQEQLDKLKPLPGTDPSIWKSRRKFLNKPSK